MKDIYYIEDDENIGVSVKGYLDQRGYAVSVFSTVSKAQKALNNHVPALVLIDWNMPDRNGDFLLKWIRSRWKKLPVIFITVRNDTRHMVFGLESGADDYVVKPFELEVLFSRIRALLRRAGNAAENLLSCGTISIDKNRMMVFEGQQEIAVSQTEYKLLLLLMINKGRTVTRDRLLTEIWDSSGNYVNDNTLTVTVKRLREKLGHPACLKTIRSFGYRMEEEE